MARVRSTALSTLSIVVWGTRFPGWTADEDRMEMVHTSTVRGPEKLPILL